MLPTESIRRVLDAGLAKGADLAEVYLENKESLSLTLDEGGLEKATQGNDIGGGVRVFHGNPAAYAYTDDLTEESLRAAAGAAAAAAEKPNIEQGCTGSGSTTPRVFGRRTTAPLSSFRGRWRLRRGRCASPAPLGLEGKSGWSSSTIEIRWR